jgi:cytochrome c oxidase subunit 2
MNAFHLFPPEASLNARQVDVAFWSIFAIAGAILLLVFVLIVVFGVRYRRGSHAKRGPLPDVFRREIEIGWTSGITFVGIFIFWFFVGGMQTSGGEAPGQMEIHVVAKQWMWKAEHANGTREIDALHVPVDTPVRLVMTSDDVIHSFYVPAFRLKQDVLPGRDTELVFTPSRLGTFHLFCAEFCGTQHSHMTGEVVVMSQPAFAAWVTQQPHGGTLTEEGEALFAKLGCGACHAERSRVNAPKLAGVYGSVVPLSDGHEVRADEAYVRDAILHPRAQIVRGFPPIMPDYSAVISTREADAIVAYVKSLGTRGEAQ